MAKKVEILEDGTEVQVGAGAGIPSVMISGQERDHLIPPSTPPLPPLPLPTVFKARVSIKRDKLVSQCGSFQYLLFRLTTIFILFLLTGILIVSYCETDKEFPTEKEKIVSKKHDDEFLFLILDKTVTITELDDEIFEPPEPIPLVLWHGMGDTGVGIKFGLRFIEEEIPGIYIKSLQFGSNPAKDMENGYFLNVNDQVETACNMIRNDSKLANGFNAMGVSQGGQFLRALAQRCTGIKMINLISLGGQHQGIFGVPKCSAPKRSWCEIIDKLLTHVAYSSWVQKFLVQAEYWHDPFNEGSYIQNSVFLADINNERDINPTYKENLLKLKNFILIKFDGDTIVEPKESEWFGFYRNNTDKVLYTMEESELYQQDKIGLKTLNESGRLHLLSVPGDHLQFSKDWFTNNVLKPFLI